MPLPLSSLLVIFDGQTDAHSRWSGRFKQKTRFEITDQYGAATRPLRSKFCCRMIAWQS